MIAPLGRTSDFSAIAERYDATRGVPTSCLHACYDRLTGRGLLPAQGAILDAGCGTGQMSLPLAERGHAVHGIDISAAMLELARAKLQRGWTARYTVADVRRLPLADGSIDAVVVSKLFQHVEGWETACSELIRVLRPGGALVHINERGAFGNPVRRYFSKRADELGFTMRFVGANPHSFADLRKHMAGEGCESLVLDCSDLRWEAPIRRRDAYEQARDRLHAEFWYLPEEAHARILADTKAWIETEPGGWNAIDRMEPYLTAEVFRTPGRI